MTAPTRRRTWPAIDLLVVDDEPQARLILRALLDSLLGELGRVHAAASGERAIELAHGIDFSFILLDYRLAGCDGLETTRQIRAFNPRSPIILVTAADRDPALEAAARASGANDLVYKPLARDVLSRLIATHAPQLLAMLPKRSAS